MEYVTLHYVKKRISKIVFGTAARRGSALAEKLQKGKLYAAGLVSAGEKPIKGDNPTLKGKNCFITPHISWAAVEGGQRLVDFAIENVKVS